MSEPINGAPINGERALILHRLDEHASTLSWLRKAVGEIRDALARSAPLSDEVKDHEQRLRVVERAQVRLLVIAGAAVVIATTGATVVAGVLVYRITRG